MENLYEDEDGEDGDLGNQQSSMYMNVDENEYLQKLPKPALEKAFRPCFYQKTH